MGPEMNAKQRCSCSDVCALLDNEVKEEIIKPTNVRQESLDLSPQVFEHRNNMGRNEVYAKIPFNRTRRKMTVDRRRYD